MGRAGSIIAEIARFRTDIYFLIEIAPLFQPYGPIDQKKLKEYERLTRSE